MFLAANRNAYGGFFQGDELDNIGWTPQVSLSFYAVNLVNPFYNTKNFRPVGHLYFRLMSRAFGLDFPIYLLTVQLLHLFNVWLLWMVLGRLGASRFAAAAGAVFFTLELAVFDVYWKPMYVFDVFCCTFCLLSLLAWIERRWVLSFAAFWLAYKSKELAVMLPGVLACYELWYGKRRWRPLIPFFAASLAFGIGGVLFSPKGDNPYALQFTPSALGSGVTFYAGALFGIPFAGFALLAMPVLRRDRLMWLGTASSILFLIPLVFLPGRLYPAYWYVPLTGVAMAFASLAAMRYGWIAALFLAAWLPWNYIQLAGYGRRKLADDAGTRAYVGQIKASAASLAGIPAYLYHGLPANLSTWGLGGALRYFLGLDIKTYGIDDPAAQQVMRKPAFAILAWDHRAGKLSITAHHPDTPDASYIVMNQTTPVWQLEDGWYGLESDLRWMSPHAAARVYRSASSSLFELVANVSPQLFAERGYITLAVRLNGVLLPPVELRETNIRTARWTVPPAPAGPVEVELQADPPYHPRNDPRTLGVAVMSFGFLPAR